MVESILLVEDDRDIVRVVKTYLEREGYQVEVAFDGLSGLERALVSSPALIILDWMLPALDGLAFMKRLRKERTTPVIMLTARTEESDRILGLEFGADDYVTKPFSPRELVARVKAVLRRVEIAGLSRETFLRVGSLVIDSHKRTVTREGEELDLTTLEFDLLYTFAQYPGRVFRRDELLERVWGGDFMGVDRVVDVHVSNLRHKLEIDPSHPVLLLTVRGVGYKLVEDS
ncbi:MAG: response regulator transcription factor [Trueperaceae bacterium]|nr:MAG: response regulator transcription factor [Trueperaceae bacterium]